MRKLKTISIILLALVPTLFISAAQRRSAPRPLKSQTSKIVGTVLDANNARIVGAKIKIENEQFSREMLSDDQGIFKIELPAGVYRITVEAAGFQTVKLFPVQAKARVSKSVNIHMEVQPPGGLLKVE
jgi:Carboxypeptidase regulatory-like domain